MDTDLLAQRAMDHLDTRGFEAASEVERVLATVWLFAAGVANEGFLGYYSGKRGDLAFFAPQVLRKISAFQLAALAEEANAAFGPAGPSRDRKQRCVVISQIPESTRILFERLDKAFFESTEDVDELMENYLALHATKS